MTPEDRKALDECVARWGVDKVEIRANLADARMIVASWGEEPPKRLEVRIWEALVGLFNNGADEAYQTLRRWFIKGDQ